MRIRLLRRSPTPNTSYTLVNRVIYSLMGRGYTVLHLRIRLIRRFSYSNSMRTLSTPPNWLFRHSGSKKPLDFSPAIVYGAHMTPTPRTPRKTLATLTLIGATFYAGTVVGQNREENRHKCYEDSVRIVLAGSDERVCFPVDNIPQLLQQERASR